ncbi:MAG: endonuclease MutS2, partial [Acidobacteria bacterium]
EWDAQVLETLGEPESADSGAQDRVKAAPAVGDRVRVQDLSTPGTVSSLLDDDHLQVEVGRLRMRVRKDEVRVLGSASVPPAFSKSRVSGKVEVSGDTVDAPAEINVIGSTAEEACEQVDKFLDQAYLAGRARLRIIHGHGKGILRTSLHEMFASHPHVEKFYSAPPNEGGAGATIVELKV